MTDRAARVFVSSTFHDFVAERERLARFTFPALRRLFGESAHFQFAARRMTLGVHSDR